MANSPDDIIENAQKIKRKSVLETITARQLRMICFKLFKIPVKKLEMYARLTTELGNIKWIEIDNDQRLLTFYGIENSSQIVVVPKQW